MEIFHFPPMCAECGCNAIRRCPRIVCCELGSEHEIPNTEPCRCCPAIPVKTTEWGDYVKVDIAPEYAKYAK